MAYVKNVRRDNAQYGIKAMALDADLDATLLHKSELENDFTQTEAGLNALDAAAGKTLNDAMIAKTDGILAGTEEFEKVQLNNGAYIMHGVGTHPERTYFVTGDTGVGQCRYVFEEDGRISVSRRTRASVDDEWGSWSNWSYANSPHTAGTTFTFNDIIVPGLVTSFTSVLRISVPTRGVFADRMTVNRLSVVARDTDGKYALADGTNSLDVTSKVTGYAIAGDVLNFTITPGTWTNTPVNNTPLVVQVIGSVTFT